MQRNLIAALVLALCLPAMAIAKSSEAKDPGQVLDRMAKDLGLSADQKAQVETIFKDEQQTVEGIFKEQEEKLKTAQEQTRSSLQQVLTPEQLDMLDKKIAERNKKRSSKKR